MNLNKGTLYYFSTRLRGQVTPSYECPCAITLETTDGDKHTYPMNVGAVKKYFVKKIRAR
jgi:hypothetical protein